MSNWRLDQEPRQYRRLDEKTGKWTWCVEGSRARIASVTTVLGEDPGLQNWAVGRTIAAAHQVARAWYGPDPDSLLGFGQLCELTGEMPDQIRDRAAAVGTAAHDYLGAALAAPGLEDPATSLFGLRSAIDDFLDEWNVLVCTDEHGPRIERAVGDAALGVAGTYDAQVMMVQNGLDIDIHRIDLEDLEVDPALLTSPSSRPTRPSRSHVARCPASS